MADRLTKAARSAHMARIRRRDTRPELIVRRLLHRLGYRFRIQLGGVPGRPDVAFTRRKKAIFIHGCFWHAHEKCSLSRIPKTRTRFWTEKFAANRERDRRLEQAAKDAGWKCLVVWECELKEAAWLERNLVKFLGPKRLRE
ncbi:very short patch repair endonuclease [Bradyrhizobium japonicum]|uniref:very short patch repair endonuclease n=2 Tax=Bradyrhizobium japonicum TaxID=375 RepID=UPI0009B82025|nr:DNA mismatch endonuclease Vsr [Bradyrhizobium japonicum]MYV86684.1 DNA mismatch endonuclease Vsr [Bradyrhizobium japonicum]